MADYVQISSDHPAAANRCHSQTRNNTAKDSFSDVLEAQENGASGLQSGDVRTKTGREKDANGQDTDYRKQLQEHMEEMADRIKHGTIQPKIAIGAQEYTQEEWKKLLEKFDDAEAELAEQLKEQIEVLKAQAEKEKAALENAAKENEAGEGTDTRTGRIIENC